jgi:hypothetical protein
MSKFEYLPSIVSMTLFCYFLTLVAYKYGLTLLVDTCYCCNCILSDDKDEFFGNRPTEKDGKVKFRFEDTYESFLPGLQYVLVITRLLSLCYIFLVPIISKATTTIESIFILQSCLIFLWKCNAVNHLVTFLCLWLKCVFVFTIKKLLSKQRNFEIRLNYLQWIIWPVVLMLGTILPFGILSL